MDQRAVAIELNAAIIAVTGDSPRVLVVDTKDGVPEAALPFGPFDAARDRTMERGLRRWVSEQTQLELGYVEQLYTFGDQFRHPQEIAGGPRIVSVGYLALTRQTERPKDVQSRWSDWYDYFPWEDWRQGAPRQIEGELVPQLHEWARAVEQPAQRRRRRERVDLAFGLAGSGWNDESVLERYELLYEAGLVSEALRDRGSAESRVAGTSVGVAMALDHRRILATAIGRLRAKIKYRPVVFELLAPTFTLLQFQRAVEALAGRRLHKGNFRRLVEAGGLVEPTGAIHQPARGRPAEEFRFRQDVLHERGLPGLRLGGQTRVR
ncbi:MAG TPA: hypothetical protein VME66_00965 [Candidatus Acidoferrales bacterium]|nr:hypothetical protein [Candidatus Acidoferrales bacterium]